MATTGGKTVKVANSYFDEALEMSDTDEAESQSYRQTDQPAHGGDSPPSAKLSMSEDDYGEGEGDGTGGATHEHDDDDDDYDEQHRAEDEAFEEAIKKGREGLANSHISTATSIPVGPQGIPNAPKFVPSATKTGGLQEEEESHMDSDGTSGRFESTDSKDEIKQLLEYISRYTPQDQDLEPVLKPFIPDLIPAIGDIDAFIKIPRVDQKPDMLGLALLDEPSANQSDPSVLDLHLRAVSKSSAVAPQVVRSIDSSNLRNDPKPIDMWIKNIKDLHGKKPPPSVHYSRQMPDIEELMQVWPSEVESAFESTQLPTAEIDLPLQKYCSLIALLLDIPVSTSAPASDNKPGSDTKKATGPNHLVEALHVIFTLYSEFKNSVHFKAMERTRQNGVGQPAA